MKRDFKSATALHPKCNGATAVQRGALFADADALLNRAIERAARLSNVRDKKVNGVLALDVLRARLMALPEPERRLLCGLLSGIEYADSVSFAHWVRQLNQRSEESVP